MSVGTALVLVLAGPSVTGSALLAGRALAIWADHRAHLDRYRNHLRAFPATDQAGARGQVWRHTR